MDVPGIALITGAASGIGRACAAAFATEGSSGIALLDINAAALASVQSEVEAAIASSPRADRHCRVSCHVVDVADENGVDGVVDEVVSTYGRIDYVVNCAGVAVKHVGGAAFAETEQWKRVLDVNLNGTFYVLRAVARVMLKQDPIVSCIDGRPLQRGSIVNFGSIQAVVGITLSTSYGTSKHAVLGLTRTASEDYAELGLRVNAICPGYTETPLTTKNPDVLKAMMERVGTMVPMKRMGSPREIADGVLYLAGGRSSFVTGTALMVDGGYTCR